jgi:hypothetical protein
MVDRRKSTSQSDVERRNRNRRAFPRWKTDFEVRYQSGKEMIKAAEPYEIGEGGLSFGAAEPISMDTELAVEYRLSAASDWVKVKAIVRHVQGKRIGVEFLNLHRPDRLKIIDHISAGAR